MLRLAFPHDPMTPDEYESDNTLECEDCGDVFDGDLSYGEEVFRVETEQGEIYLCQECRDKRRNAEAAAEQERPDDDDA